MSLTFNPGEVKTFQIQAESYKAYPRHWVGREYKPCSGAGCALCAAGVTIRNDFMMPIVIGGVSDVFIFSLGIAQQFDALTQQGLMLLGLLVTVSRSPERTNTRYQVALAAPAQPALPPASAPGAVPVVQPIDQPLPVTEVIGEISRLRASDWAKLMGRLLTRRDFMDIIASEFQAMKDEGLWQ
uniref:Uncharacterized protein n=1 Tax=viral metagenome TaxID=1070528 RepID=A0A6M3Y0C8_9ZZZZ